MTWRSRACAPCSAVLLMLFAAVPATAPARPAPKPITGKLSKPGYTVIALAANGAARSARASLGRFRLRPPAGRVTLHLRAPAGTYAGPIVLGRELKGKRAILGVMAGAKLGRVKLKPAGGYARPNRKLAAKWVDATRTARARKGIPIGAGNFGLVLSKRTHDGLLGDTDLDGISDTLDVDDDGDLILDDYDRSIERHSTARRPPKAKSSGAIGGTFPDGSRMTVGTSFGFAGPGAVNVNGGSSEEQIAAAQQNYGGLGILWLGIDPGSGELDCGALIYCSAGGTGRFQASVGPGGFDRTGAPPFPECCDPDEDGLGSLTPIPPPPGAASPFGPDGGGMSLFHGATQDQIRTGDVLIERATVHGSPVESAASVGFVFSTMPALATYSDGQGNSSSFSYPLASCGEGLCALPVRAGPNGDAIVTLTFWRPQRQRVLGEPGAGEWMDVGNLTYATEAGGASGVCPESSYSGLDANLTSDPLSANHAGPPTNGGFRLLDLSGDQPSDPANTFTFTLNLTDCLTSKGLSMGTTSFASIVFTAFSETDGEGIAMANFPAVFVLQP